jgi:hypothetical protein
VPAQVEGADFRFQERMRGVVEYMQFREMPADIKRKVGSTINTFIPCLGECSKGVHG